MSINAESKAQAAALGQDEWNAAPAWERSAINKAMEAYQDSPGTSTRVAMLRACRKYAAIVNAAVGTIKAPHP